MCNGTVVKLLFWWATCKHWFKGVVFFRWCCPFTNIIVAMEAHVNNGVTGLGVFFSSGGVVYYCGDTFSGVFSL